MDLREYLFAGLENKRCNFTITSREQGIFSGAVRLKQLADELGLEIIKIADEGSILEKGSSILKASGSAGEVIRAEEMLLGAIGKPSGVATAAADFVRKANGKIKVVCGAWKKVASEIRNDLRRAIGTGGAGIRMTDQPFIYLDKNYVRILGGVRPTVVRAREFDSSRIVAVQVRGEMQPIVEESLQAFEAGAGIIMVDTGKLDDIEAVITAANKGGWRDSVEIAFAGNVSAADIAVVIDIGADIVDVGRAIIDAPLLDLSLDIV